MALPEDGDCLYVRGIRFTDTPPQISGLATPNAVQQELTAEFAVGYRSSGFAVSCLVYAADGYQDLPGDWQETAVQRCREELLYLFNLSNDDQRLQLYQRLNSMLTPYPWALEDPSFPLEMCIRDRCVLREQRDEPQQRIAAQHDDKAGEDGEQAVGEHRALLHLFRCV